MKKVPKIDIHAHVTAFPETYPPNRHSGQRMLSGPELIEIYDKLNIEKGVILPISSPEGNCSPMTSESCRFVAETYPDRFVWFCNVDARCGDNSNGDDLIYFVEHYKKLGARGAGEITTNIPADAPLMDKFFSACEELDMPVLFHVGPQIGSCYGIVDELGLPRIEKMLKKHKNLKFIGHSQPFWAEMSADITEKGRNGYPQGKVTEGRLYQLMRECPNLYCDLSAGSGANAMRRDPENAAKFMAEFSDRILYGCDICAACNVHQYEFDAFLTKMCEDGMLSEENYYKIVRGNALKILKLEE